MDLDKELHYRGARYPNDCNINVVSKAAAQIALNFIARFFKNRFKLLVNLDKSASTSVAKRDFLRFASLHKVQVPISKDHITRFKGKIHLITKRNLGVKIDALIRELN